MLLSLNAPPLLADFKSPAELVDMDVLAEAFQQSEGAAAAKADGASEEGAPERDPLTGGREGCGVLVFGDWRS
jgi:hypothetical protein